MAADKKSSRPGREIDALLHRLHSGCRFVNFEADSRDCRRGGGGRHDASALLRNASPPDETHSELGRALAHSYAASVRSLSSTAESPSRYEDLEKGVIEAGDRVVRSLCCGEDAAGSNGSDEAIMHSERANYASVAYAFFGHLQLFVINKEEDASSREFVRSQWHKWCVRCEELIEPTMGVASGCNGGGFHILHACLKSFGFVSYFESDGANIDGDGTGNSGCVSVYESLTHHSSRKYLIRTCVAQAFNLAQSNNNTGMTIDLLECLSGLFHSCVLSARKEQMLEPSHLHEERRLLLQEILRGCGTLLHRVVSHTEEASQDGETSTLIGQISNMTQYLTQSLTSYLNQDIHASFYRVAHGHKNEDSESSTLFEFGYDWLHGICDLMTKLSSIKGNGAINEIAKSTEIITSTIIPQFTASSAAAFQMIPIYSSLTSCINFLPKHSLLPMANAIVAMRLGSLSLSLVDDSEVQLMCDLTLGTFSCFGDTNDGSYSTLLIGGILAAIGRVFRCRPACFDGASRLKRLGESMLRRELCGHQEENHPESEGTHLMDIVVHSLRGEAFQPLMDIISASISDAEPPRRPLSLSDQCSGLLLGLSLLHISISSSEAILEPDCALAFLRSFLQCYPRMVSRAVPSIVDIARSIVVSLQLPTSQTLLASLEFLASPCVVSDPHGAHLSWTFLSSLTKDGVPTAVRSSVIRLLPRMCSSNKRLFRRASDVVGKSMFAQDPIIRISATAALSDMANLDLLRDVEQIVGWVQNRLTDEEPAVVYYALETLRFLVVNEELEFDLVIHVLEKRLSIDLSDVNVILDLDVLALEGLVALLGEGGLEEDDDDDESNDGIDAGGPEVSPQSVKAVTFLIELALSDQPSIKNNVGIQRRIYGSLKNYSADVLGLNEESIRSWNGTPQADASEDMQPEVMRFLHLKEIVLTGLDFATQLYESNSSTGKGEVKEIAAEVLKSVTTIGKIILKFEEDVHGSFLFRGGYSSGRGSSEKAPKGKTASRNRVSKSVLSSLPSAPSIHEMFESDPRSSSATAMFYSIGYSDSDPNTILQTEDILVQMSECFSDIESEPLVDPAFQATLVCSVMHSMDIVWKSIQATEESVREELLNQVVAQIEDWSATFGGELAYVAMAALVLFTDDSAQCWQGVSNIQNTILEESYIFESEDKKSLCLAMVAARLSRTADARVTRLIDSIEQSLLENTRQTCFGAFFGLGIIASNLMTGSINGTDPSDTWRRQQAQRILCILLSMFNTCLKQENVVVLSLISSIKRSQAANDLSQLCTNLDTFLVQDGYEQKMKAIMIGLSHCFAVLNAISNNYFRSVLHVVDKLPWGTGKSFALCAAYKNGIKSGIMDQADISEQVAITSSHVQESSNDALLSLASLGRLSSRKSQQVLDLVAKTCHKNLLDRNASVSSEEKLMTILAAIAAIGDLPGIASFTPDISTAAKKNFVSDIVQMLEEVVANDYEDLKYRDAATMGLGILCAMSRSSNVHQKMKNTTNKFDMQAKDGSAMEGIMQEVERAYSLLCTAPSHKDTNRYFIATKLCALFSSLEQIAMPGNFSRIIELTLNDSGGDASELKVSAVKLLASQLDPAHRRIGFDGRGFVDLSTRLAKMDPSELCTLVGPQATPFVAKLLANLIYQIPTSIGEDVVKSLWTICRTDLTTSLSPQSTTEFLVGLKSILTPVIREEKSISKRNTSISPALLRTLQKVIVNEIFSDLCTYAVPSNKIDTETVWITYLQCVELLPRTAITEAEGLNCDITRVTCFGMAVCAPLSAKFARKVDSWLALQAIDATNLRILLLSTLAIATQDCSDDEMKESVLSMFEVMLIKGLDTMTLYLMAAKVAFFWESRRVHQLEQINMPIRRVSKMSLFLGARNLSFGVRNLPQKVLIHLFCSLIDDLPSKIAALCKLWQISDDVSNRASRIWNAYARQEENNANLLSSHRIRSLACVKEIVQLNEGGEI